MSQDFSRDQLTLAFTWHLARQLTHADLDVSTGEASWLAERFPAEQLADAGFVTLDGHPTARFEEALGEALASLPDDLELPEKLELITTLFEGTLVDDEFHHAEGDVLVRAARLLGVSHSELDAHLGSLEAVGEVELTGEIED